ncbi:IS3 family transposase [Tissierella sp. P1]|uniref:IS3 family transposase n=1 Tax=Tissierella sp. P1 TaxID=1280483 RepID=UPI003514D1E2
MFFKHEGWPYDNVIAEVTFKMLKTEFTNNYHFESLEQLEYMLICLIISGFILQWDI